MKRFCVVDAKGRDVHCGDTVVDSYAERHVVTAFAVIDEKTAWIEDEHGKRLIPHLTERAEGDRNGK